MLSDAGTLREERQEGGSEGGKKRGEGGRE